MQDFDGYRGPGRHVRSTPPKSSILPALTSHLSGVANGLASTFRLMGGAVATAIYSAILSNQFASNLPIQMSTVIQYHRIPSSEVPELLQKAALNTAAAYQSLLDLSGMTPQAVADTKNAVKAAYVDSFKLVYLVAIAFGGIAIICASLTRNIPKEKKTSRRAVKMENEAAKHDTEKV